MQRSVQPMSQGDIYIQEMVFNGHNGETALSTHLIEIAAGSYKTPFIVRPQNADTLETYRLMKAERINRMLELIKILAGWTVAAHDKEKDNYPALVTRLVMDEFSLYTSNEPLSVPEFKYLSSKISELAAQLPPNIHMVIGTIPVLWSDFSVRNSALYIQSPLSPERNQSIHYFYKKNTSNIDFTYTDAKANLYQVEAKLPPLAPDVLLQNCGITFNDDNQFEYALKIDLGDRSFINILEICLDHKFGLGVLDLLKLIQHFQTKGIKPPVHLIQVLVSNSIKRITVNCASSITQADKLYSTESPITMKENLGDLPFCKQATLTTHAPKKLHISHQIIVLLSFIISGHSAEDLLRMAVYDLKDGLDTHAIERLLALRGIVDFRVLGAEGEILLRQLNEMEAILASQAAATSEMPAPISAPVPVPTSAPVSVSTAPVQDVRKFTDSLLSPEAEEKTHTPRLFKSMPKTTCPKKKREKKTHIEREKNITYLRQGL